MCCVRQSQAGSAAVRRGLVRGTQFLMLQISVMLLAGVLAQPARAQINGTWYSVYEDRGDVRVTLELREQNRAVMTRDYRNGRDELTGTWKPVGNRVELFFNRLDGRSHEESMILDNRGTSLIASVYDKDVYPSGLVFTRNRPAGGGGGGSGGSGGGSENFEGKYYSRYEDRRDGWIGLELEIRRDGEARMVSLDANDRRTGEQRGDWRVRNSRLLIDFDWKDDDRDYEEEMELRWRNRDELETTSWRKAKYGNDPLRFSTRREGSGGNSGNYEGKYYSRYEDRQDGRVALELEIRRGGEARMVSLDANNRRTGEQRGNWQIRNSRLLIDFNWKDGDKNYKEQMELRRRNRDELETTSWNKRKYGNNALRFSTRKSSGGTDGGTDEWTGTYRSDYRDADDRQVNLQLELRGGGEARMTSTSAGNRNRSVQTGTWGVRDNRIAVEFNRLDDENYRENMELKWNNRDELETTSWDRRKYGGDPLRFRRR